MSERKFSRGLGKPGMAAQLRETVSQVVRESTDQVKVNIPVQLYLRPARSNCFLLSNLTLFIFLVIYV